jgi:hypothetical protein
MRAKVTFNDLSADTIFMMSFGASTQANERQGFWRRVPNVPDLTVDLRLYVPSFDDRQWEEIRFPCREILRLAECVLRKALVTILPCRRSLLVS